MSARARCLLADDHPALAAAIEAYAAEPGFDVVGVAADGDDAVAQAERTQPDVAVVDLHMPRCGGAALVTRLRAVAPRMRVVVYTAEADADLAAAVLAAGADGIVLKEAPLADLGRALGSVLAGRPYVDPAVALPTLGANGRTQLTAREREVLELLAEGLTHHEIGRRLDIGAETVRTHARKAADRLDARTRTQAVAEAIRLGLLR